MRGLSRTYFKLILAVFIGMVFFVAPISEVLPARAVNISALVYGVCGNGTKEWNEQCDGNDLGGQTCTSQGFSGGGILSCNANCTFNTSSCIAGSSGSGGGGGGGGGGGVGGVGGGGGGVFFTPQTAVIFSGKASAPASSVTVLKDAQVVTQTVADAGANFQITVSGLSAGNYIFAVYSEDNQGRRSSLLTFPVSVTAGATAAIGNIFIAPTIVADKSEVKRGDNIAIFGQSVPKAYVAITVNSDQKIFGTVSADASGVYLYNLDTSPLDIGQHYVKSKAALAADISDFSNTISFTVGTRTILVPKTNKVSKGDVNGDGRVNLVDFSILAYWYKKPNPPARVDLDGDGKADLIDFSIMAYYWTG